MVKLVRHRDNRIPVKVTSFLDYSGFSATMEVEGQTKEVPNLKSANAKLEFFESEVDSLAEFVLGHMTVYNAKGEVHMKILVQIQVVEDECDAIDFQTLRFAIVSLFKYEGGGGGVPSKDVVKRSDFARITNPDASINSCQNKIIDILTAAKGEE